MNKKNSLAISLVIFSDDRSYSRFNLSSLRVLLSISKLSSIGLEYISIIFMTMNKFEDIIKTLQFTMVDYL